MLKGKVSRKDAKFRKVTKSLLRLGIFILASLCETFNYTKPNYLLNQGSGFTFLVSIIKIKSI